MAKTAMAKPPKKDKAAEEVAANKGKSEENGKPADSASLEKGTEDDAAQNYIKGFEPERDNEIESLMDPWIEEAKKKDAAEAAISENRTKITGLLRDKGLSSYRYKGYTAKFKPGDDTVQLAKPKQK